MICKPSSDSTTKFDLLAMRIGIALGSNLEDRLLNIRTARELLLPLHDPDGPFLSSRIYETCPVDCPEGSLPFLNAVIELSSSLEPLDLLGRLLAIERQLGRPSGHPYHAPRTIDLDLLYCDNVEVSLPTLTLPHPRISERLFVLKPMADVCPDRALNRESCSVREMCESQKLWQESLGVQVFSSSV